MSEHHTTTDPDHSEALPVELVASPPGRLLTLTAAGLVGALLLCIAGVIYLAAAGTEVPEVLAVTTGGVTGALAGLLVNPHRARY